MKRLTTLTILLTISIIIPSIANADYAGFSFDYTMTHADLVVVGNVYGMVENNTITTYRLMKFNVERYYKGSGPQLIEVRLKGGAGMWVEDQAELNVGYSYLLFLRQEDGFNYVLGGPGGAALIRGRVASNT